MATAETVVSSRSSSGSRWLRLVLSGCAIMVLLAVGMVGWRVLHVRSQQSALKAKLAELAAAGKAVDAARVKQLHEERTDDALTSEWRALFTELSEPDLRIASSTLPIVGTMEGEANRIPPRGEVWEMDTDARKFLGDTKAVRDRLRKLAVKGRAVFFPMQFEEQGKGSSEAHDGIQFAVRLLHFEALAALRYNAPAAAVEVARSLLTIPNVLEGEPSMMSMSVSGSAEMAALDVVKTAVEQRALNEVQLVQTIEMLRSFEPLNERFKLAVQGERGMLQTALDSLATKQGLTYFAFGSPTVRLATLELLDRLEAAPLDDPHGFFRVGKQVQGEIEDLGFGSRGSTDALAPTALIPITARAAVVANREMERRLAMLAVAIQLYRSNTGKLPAEISEVIAAVAKLGVNAAELEPIGGKPFGYRVSEDGSSATVWGFSLLSNTKQTPDEPPEIDDPLGQNRNWVWRL